jgi:hypothetical protein
MGCGSSSNKELVKGEDEVRKSSQENQLEKEKSPEIKTRTILLNKQRSNQDSNNNQVEKDTQVNAVTIQIGKKN